MVSVFKNRKAVGILLACALVLALLLEAFLFTARIKPSFDSELISLSQNEGVQLLTQNYTVTDNRYAPSGADPQLIFTGVNAPVQTVVLRFSDPLTAESAIEIFYSKSPLGFSGECVTENQTVPSGTTEYILSLPYGEYADLRIDLDGVFTLADVLVCDRAATYRIDFFAAPFSLARLVSLFLLLSAAGLFLLCAIGYRSKDPNASRTFFGAHPLLTLTAMMLFTAVITFFSFLFFDRLFIYSDIGSDTKNVYYPFFAALQRKLATGDLSLWDFTHGLGTNAITRQADVGSIFTWLCVIFGAEAVKYLFPLVQILKILASGYACYAFLDCFKLSPFSKVLASYALAFNGFTMLWGQHYFFATAALCTTLVLWGVEKALASHKGTLLLALSTAFVALQSYYFAYMVLLFAGIYALFRLAAIYTWREIPTAFGKIALLLGGVLLGIGMAAVLFLPAVYTVISTSARLDNGASLWESIVEALTLPFFDAQTMAEILPRFFSNNLNGLEYPSHLNMYETPQWFFSSFILFFVFLFISNLFFEKGERGKLKLLKTLALLLLAFLAFHPFLSFVLNGFVKPFFRYTFLAMPVFAWLTADMTDRILQRRLRHPRLQIGVCAGVFLLLLLLVTLPAFGEKINVHAYLGCAYLLLALALFAAFVLLQRKPSSLSCRRACMASIAAVLLLNVTADAFIVTNVRTSVSESHPIAYTEGTNQNVQEALAYVARTDPSFHRTDKTFLDLSFLNDGMLEGYYGASVYNSVVNKNIIRFVREICPSFKVTSADGYYDFREIYQNVPVVSLLGVKYVLSASPIEDVPEYRYIQAFGNVYLYENTATDGVGRFYSATLSEEDFLALTPEQRQACLSHTLILEQGASTTGGTPEASATVQFARPQKSNRVFGTVTTDTDGWLMLSIPCEDGWSATVDAETVPITRADLAFCAIPVKAGTHEVVFSYRTPYLAQGALISLGSATLCLTLYFLIRRRERRTAAVQNPNT